MAGTQIAGAGGSNPFGQISSALAPIYSMFGSGSGGSSGGGGNTNFFGTNLSGAGAGGNVGDPTNAFGVTISPNTNNPQNISTYASLANLLGTAAPAELTAGGNMINLGTDVTGAGLGVTGSGLSMFGTPYNYYQQLASGNPQAVANAAGPYANLVSQNLTNALAQNKQGTPAGGAQAVFQAGAPQAAAGQVSNYELGLQPQAEQAIANMASQIAGIGSNISGTGQQIAGTGTTMTGQAQQTMQNIIADALQKVGLNYQYGGPQTFATLMQPIAQGVGAFLGAKCWIAEAIYGADSRTTRLLRGYLNGPFSDSVCGRVVMWLYGVFGRAIARQVRKRGWVKRAIKPLFDRALDRAFAAIAGIGE